MKRRPTLELRNMIEGERFVGRVSPLPPPPSGASLREWFAGLAINNPVLMTGIEPDSRVSEAVRIADELMKALATTPLPARESMTGLSDEVMTQWANDISEKERRTRVTAPALRRAKGPRTKTRTGVLPPPLSIADTARRASDSFVKVNEILRDAKPTRPAPPSCRYSIIDETK